MLDLISRANLDKISVYVTYMVRKDLVKIREESRKSRKLLAAADHSSEGQLREWCHFGGSGLMKPPGPITSPKPGAGSGAAFGAGFGSASRIASG
jgi:hypothetical protein